VQQLRLLRRVCAAGRVYMVCSSVLRAARLPAAACECGLQRITSHLDAVVVCCRLLQRADCCDSATDIVALNRRTLRGRNERAVVDRSPRAI
jgi:hypothetical protein